MTYKALPHKKFMMIEEMVKDGKMPVETACRWANTSLSTFNNRRKQVRGINRVEQLLMAEFDLFPEQAEIVYLILQGKTNLDIAEELGKSEKAVKSSLTIIYYKCDVNSRYALTAKAAKVYQEAMSENGRETASIAKEQEDDAGDD